MYMVICAYAADCKLSVLLYSCCSKHMLAPVVKCSAMLGLQAECLLLQSDCVSCAWSCLLLGTGRVFGVCVEAPPWLVVVHDRTSWWIWVGW